MQQPKIRMFSNLPQGWREERLNDVASIQTSNVDKKSADGEKQIKLCNYVNVYYNDAITSNIDFMEASATDLQIERFTLHAGDVVFTKDSESPDDIGIPALVAEEIPNLVCGYHLAILRPFDGLLHGAYLFYVLAARQSAYQFYLAANGVTRFGLTHQGTKNVRIAFPCVAEQIKIAAFLDWKTRQIDALIVKKQELLQKLKEKRLAVITQAVTKGLNPDAPMRDSGIAWLGDIPAHWKLKSLRRVVSNIEQGWSPECENTAAALDDWGVVKAGCCNGGTFNPEENKTLPSDLSPPENLEIRAGDLLMSRANGSEEFIGAVALVPANTRRKLILSDKTYRLRYESSVAPEFLAHTLQSPLVRFQVVAAISGASGLARNIAQSDVKNFLLPTPPLPEQRLIARYLDLALEKLVAMRSKAESAITRLTEYRSALITAATTGKIDVRGWQNPAM